MPHIVYLVIVDGHMGCFQFLAILNNSATDIHVQGFGVDICFLFFWVYAQKWNFQVIG